VRFDHPDRRRREGDVLQERSRRVGGARQADVKVLRPGWGTVNEKWRKRDSEFKNSTEVIKPQVVVDQLWNCEGRDTYITSTSASIRCGPRIYYRSSSRDAG